MNIKHCNAIVVEENGTREIFCEGDIVCVEYIENLKDYFCQEDIVQVTATNYDGESKTMEGRFCDAYSRNAEVYILLDTSSKYHKDSMKIPVYLIKSIKKVPG